MIFYHHIHRFVLYYKTVKVNSFLMTHLPGYLPDFECCTKQKIIISIKVIPTPIKTAMNQMFPSRTAPTENISLSFSSQM